MAEYLAVPEQEVALNTPIIFNSSIPCPRGNVFHEDETGVFILRGNTNNCFARYRVVYNGNIGIPTGGAITPIAVVISVNGEPRISSRAISTPTAVATFDNVTSTAIITVPRGCCFNVSVEYVSGITGDAATVPTPVISTINNNLEITRIA